MTEAIALVANDENIPPHIDIATSNAIDQARELVHARIEEAAAEERDECDALVKDFREYLVEVMATTEKLLGTLPKEKE